MLVIFTSYLHGQEITGKIFFYYTQPSTQDGIKSFALSRTYLTIAKKVSDNITYKFQADINYNSSPQNMYIKNANVDWKTNMGKIVLGLQGMNMFKIQERTWGKRYIQKSSMDYFKYSSSADMGMGLYRAIDNLSFSTLITNGTGYKTSENDNHKKLSFQAVYGEQTLNKNDGFNIGTVYSIEKYDMDSVTVRNKSVIGFFSGYAGKRIRAGLEWNQNNDSGNKVTSQIKSLYGNYNIKSKTAVYLRYDMFSTNIKEYVEDKDYLILGVEFSPGKGLIISPNYRKTNEESEVNINFEFKF